MGYQLVHGKNHIACIALLHHFAVTGEREIKIVDRATKLFQRHERTDYSAPVKTLGHQPGQPSSLGVTLQVACREVDTQRHRIVISVSKLRLNTLPEPINSHNDLHLVLQVVGKVRVEQGQLFRIQRTVWFQKESGFFRHGGLHLARMRGIIAYDAQNLHNPIKLLSGFNLQPCSSPNTTNIDCPAILL